MNMAQVVFLVIQEHIHQQLRVLTYVSHVLLAPIVLLERFIALDDANC